MPNWNKIKAEYIRGDISQRSLAKKYGVSLSSITKRSRAEKWADLRVQKNDMVTTKMVESIASQEANKMDLLQRAADLLLKKITEGLEDGTLTATGRGLRDISGALRDIREIKGYKSELDMQEQIARIEKLRSEASSDKKDSSIVVTLEGCDGYAD